MNGQEQKERQTAVAILRRDLDELERNTLDLCKAETETRMKADDVLRHELAEAAATEKVFRKTEIVKLREEMINLIETRNADLAGACRGFIQLPWWKRLAWCLFGYKALVWLVGPSVPYPVSTRTKAQAPPLGTVYGSEKPQ